METFKKKEWQPDNDKVLVLAGGRAEPTALSHHMYLCQNERSFQPSRYMAFVNNGKIRYLFEIVAGPYIDCTPENMPIIQTIEGYDLSLHQVFYLKKIQEIGPIENDHLDKNNDPVAYTFGSPRYTTYDKILRAKKTSEL